MKVEKVLTDWITTEDGLRYRWVQLSKEDIAALREYIRVRNEQLSEIAANTCFTDFYKYVNATAEINLRKAAGDGAQLSLSNL